MLIILGYAHPMFSKVLQRLSGGKSSKSSVEQEQSVDISRVIPDYKPQIRDAEHVQPEHKVAPDVEAQSEPRSADSGTDTETPPAGGDSLILSQALPDMEDRAEAAIAALSEKHDAWAQNDLDALLEAWNVARNFPDLDGHLNEVQRTAHNLTGMAQTYGHPAMARLAASLCKLLKSGHANHQHALINLHVEACRAAYFEGAKTEGADIVAQSVCVALETQVKRTLEA
jgi:HPt (histidine-containing phosphotransfer) domain-containing protein